MTSRARARLGTPPAVGLGAFVVVLLGLVLRNRGLFTTRLYEVGDAAANSLLVNDAQSFSLLVGHYSRIGFNHPGPGMLYLQAAGEAVFYDALGLVVGPYNGQVLAVLALQAAVIGSVVAIIYSWDRRWPVPLAGLAVIALWYEGHAFAITSTWIPHIVVAPFLLLIVSAASVAAGNVRHLWLLAASAGLLVHAHVEFALFAPALTLAALLAWAITERLGPKALWQRSPRSWAIALAVVGVFLLPIALNTLLNWPGEVPKYLSYSGGEERPSPSLPEALHYARQFWVPDFPGARFVPALLTLAAAAAAWAAPRRLRRPLLAVTGAGILAEALFVVYALVGIDDLTQDYIGLFSWSVPLAMLLVLTTSVVAWMSEARPAGVAVAVVAAGLVAWSFTGDGVSLRPDSIAGLPQTFEAVEQAADSRPIVLDIGAGAGPFIEGTALLVHLEREGEDVCTTTVTLTIQVTPDRICTAEQRAEGRVFTLSEPGPPAADPPPGGTTRLPGQVSEITVVP